MNTTLNRKDANNHLIKLEGITKVYGTGSVAMHALRGIDLCIDQGEFTAVMGPSGSGKSTCMNILGCLDTPTHGTYMFKGIDGGCFRAMSGRFCAGIIWDLCSRGSIS